MGGALTVCIRCLVSGRVQGVCFRSSTRREALTLGVRGYARNLPDGRVEVLACGPRQALDALCEWLWVGSSSARVTAVDCEPADEAAPEGFEVR